MTRRPLFTLRPRVLSLLSFWKSSGWKCFSHNTEFFVGIHDRRGMRYVHIRRNFSFLGKRNKLTFGFLLPFVMLPESQPGATHFFTMLTYFTNHYNTWNYINMQFQSSNHLFVKIRHFFLQSGEKSVAVALPWLRLILKPLQRRHCKWSENLSVIIIRLFY